jgi:acetyl esterase/lipase
VSSWSDTNRGGITSSGPDTHILVLPGGGYSTHESHEAEPIAEWLEGLGLRASVFRYPLHARHPVPLEALRGEIRRCHGSGADRIGIIGFSAGGHLAGLAALAPSTDESESVDFVLMGYAITSMETETYRPSRIILLGEHATPQLRRATSLDALVTPAAPPFFIWHTAEDTYVPPEHTYRLARALAANEVAHAVHVFAHGPHSLGLARGSGDVEMWTTLAASWIAERAGASPPIRSASELNRRAARA